MKIVYHAYSDWTIDQREVLKSFGFIPEDGYSRVVIELNQTNAPLLKLLKEWRVEKFVGTAYDKQDYKNSSLFFYLGVTENGYPQPETVQGYLKATYDLSDYCDECGIGA